MISPGTEASGCALPSTRALDLARVRHRALDDDAAIEVAASVDGRGQIGRRPATFEMPTLEPMLAGLTKSG